MHRKLHRPGIRPTRSDDTIRHDEMTVAATAIARLPTTTSFILLPSSIIRHRRKRGSIGRDAENAGPENEGPIVQLHCKIYPYIQGCFVSSFHILTEPVPYICPYP